MLIYRLVIGDFFDFESAYQLILEAEARYLLAL